MAGSHDVMAPAQTLFEHVSLEQGKASIRLVRVLKSLSADGLIQCQLRHAILPPPFNPTKDDENGYGYDDEADKPALLGLDGDADEELPSYSCLSYTWGDPQKRFHIRLNDQLFTIRQNLWEFLTIASKQLDDTYFWIDALCIDQSNTSERNHQVQQMGSIFSRAATVVVWLGIDYELEQILHAVTMASVESAMRVHEEALDWLEGTAQSRSTRSQKYEMRRSSGRASSILPELDLDFTPGEKKYNPFSDTTGKVEKLLEKITEHEYWSRAWVTQEILLSKRTIVVAGKESHGLLALAHRFRVAVPYFRENAFEHIIDILLQQRRRRDGKKGLQEWGVVNLLHRFRQKKCAIRRDRIYSLLALCREGAKLTVDYHVPEEQLMRQVLNLREPSMCFCSTATVSHALSPWDFTSINDKMNTETPYAECHMYACNLSSAICPFCSNWVPFSWTRKKGAVFCLGTACPDTQGHLFWEQPDTANCTTDDHAQISSSVYAQSLQNNRSQLLCEQGSGIDIVQSEWRHVYLLRFTFRTLVELLQEGLTTTDLGLNACGNLWPNASNRAISGEGRLRFCEDR